MNWNRLLPWNYTQHWMSLFCGKFWIITNLLSTFSLLIREPLLSSPSYTLWFQLLSISLFISFSCALTTRNFIPSLCVLLLLLTQPLFMSSSFFFSTFIHFSAMFSLSTHASSHHLLTILYPFILPTHPLSHSRHSPSPTYIPSITILNVVVQILLQKW